MRQIYGLAAGATLIVYKRTPTAYCRVRFTGLQLIFKERSADGLQIYLYMRRSAMRVYFDIRQISLAFGEPPAAFTSLAIEQSLMSPQ